MSVRNLESLLRPASVALIGASDRAGSVGSVLLRNLRSAGFAGPIGPVNHRHSSVAGAPAWPTVASLPAAPDLAIICTPPSTVVELIGQLGRKGTRAAIVITAGLKQAASNPGTTLEQAIRCAKTWQLPSHRPPSVSAAMRRFVQVHWAITACRCLPTSPIINGQ